MSSAPRHASIEEATGMPWSDWVERLDAQGGRDATHKQIASRARSQMPPHVINSGWWAQSVAVAYEQYIGRRQPGQRQDGTFEVSVSTTLAGTIDQTLARWRALVADRDTFVGSAVASEPTATATSRWRRWRVRLEDGTRVAVDIGTRGGMSVLTATHGRLATREAREQARTWWKSLLAEL